MHQEINSPDIGKVYTCVFRPVKSLILMRTVYKHVSLKLMVKFVNLHWWKKTFIAAHMLWPASCLLLW